MIFDVDGTLLDSKNDITRAQQWVLGQLGVDVPEISELYPFMGKPLSVTFRHFLPPEHHSRIRSALKMYRDYYRPRALDTTVLFPHVPETLSELRDRGIHLAVATTKSTKTTLRVLSHFDIDHYFLHIQGTDDSPPKPDPAILRKILRQQTWKPDETLMIGDAQEDVEAGKAAGLRTCAVTYGALRRDQLEQFAPDFVVDDFSHLISLL